jgi:hypothetical protein
MRIREVTMDGFTVRIAPLSWDEAEKYIADGRALLNRDPKPTTEDWAQRTLESVCFTLNKAAGTLNGDKNGSKQWDIKKATSELDMIFIQHIYQEFMRMSGLKVDATARGEAQAASSGT